MRKMFMAAAVLGSGLLFAPATPAAAQVQGQAQDNQFDPALAGDYLLRGQMETGSGLRLKPDGTFEWYLVVGSLDVFASGQWSANGNTILLINDPVNRASQPYRLVSSSPWTEASAEEKRIGQGLAMPSCYSGDEMPPENPVAKPLDDAVVIQIAFDPATLPVHNGKVWTKAYPLPNCSMIWAGDPDKEESAPQYSYPDGYFLLTHKKDESLTSITVKNGQYAGANVENLSIEFPPLKPGVHRIWLDYGLFKPRMFDRLMLTRENEGLRPHFDGSADTGIYVKSQPRDDADGSGAAQGGAQ